MPGDEWLELLDIAAKRIEETRSEGIAMELVNEQIALVDSMFMRHAKLLRTMAGITETASAA